MKSIQLTNLLLVALALPACGGSDLGPSDTTPNGTDRPGDTGDLSNDLSIGSQGNEVRVLHDHLTKFGYFPNDQLAQAYPAWRPVVAHAPAKSDVYDERTAEAVKGYQTNMGLTPTGVVNQETRARMRAPRCGFPDGVPSLDPSNKFARYSSNWGPTPTLFWSIIGGTDELTLMATRQAVANAFFMWSAETLVSWIELTNDESAHIPINFADFVGGPHDNSLAFAQAPGPGLGGNITINSEYKWSTANPTPGDSFDFETVVLHEIGHALGLDHSTMNARMFPSVPPGAQGRALQLDDRVAISTIYDTFTQLSGLANDIGVSGATGEAWVIGTQAVGGNGDFTIHKWNGSSWEGSDGGARRIAVGSDGRPWIVNNAGNIYRRTTNSPTTGSWQQLSGLARDIGVGANGEAWVIGTNAVGNSDYGIFKWDGSNWVGTDGGAVRIAVGPSGEPWVVNSAGNIYRRTTNSPTSGNWVQVNGPAALDIGIADGNYAWVVGSDSVTGGHPIRVWNEQQSTWVTGTGVAGSSISVGPNAMPWIVGTGGTILKPTR